MIRSYVTNGRWTTYMDLPRSGFVIDIKCPKCGNKGVVVVEEYWKKFRKVVFMCRPCNIEIGTAKFDD